MIGVGLHRDPNKPKLPMNGYMLYLKEQRNDSDWVREATKDVSPDATGLMLQVAITRKAATEWKEMAPEPKSVRFFSSISVMLGECGRTEMDGRGSSVEG
jgi:hypothetical protein